jgi:hypothetical protein
MTLICFNKKNPSGHIGHCTRVAVITLHTLEAQEYSDSKFSFHPDRPLNKPKTWAGNLVTIEGKMENYAADTIA